MRSAASLELPAKVAVSLAVNSAMLVPRLLASSVARKQVSVAVKTATAALQSLFQPRSVFDKSNCSIGSRSNTEDLVSRLQSPPYASKLSADLARGLGPVKGLCVIVPRGKVARDRTLKRPNATEAATPNRLVRDQGEPPLDEIQPRRTRRCEVKSKARMRQQPLSDLRMFVRPVVVADQMNLASGIARCNRIEKRDELDVRVSIEAATMDSSAGHFERSEQTRRSVAPIVVRHPGRKPLAHWQNGLRPIERLDLRFLIDAEDQGTLRRIEIEADDVGHLGIELGIGAELEGLDAMGLKAVLLPQAMHRSRAELDLLRQPSHAPVSGGLRRFHRRSNHASLLRGRDCPRPTAAGASTQPFDALLPVASTPCRDRLRVDPETRGHRTHRFTCCARKNDLRPQRDCLGHGRRPQPALEHSSVLLLHQHPLRDVAHAHWTRNVGATSETGH